MVEGPSDRALLEASWDVSRKSLCSAGQPLTIAIVEAGNKTVVPIWVKYLSDGMKFPCRGLVDLDFLWNGAGRCLGSDSDLSQFTERFWNLAEQEGLLENGGGRRIRDGKKIDVFRLVLEDADLKEKADILRERLRDEVGIWVLSEGEIEAYVGLSRSTKGRYAAVSQRIRNSEMQVHSEINDVLRWAITDSQGGRAG